MMIDINDASEERLGLVRKLRSFNFVEHHLENALITPKKLHKSSKQRMLFKRLS